MKYAIDEFYLKLKVAFNERESANDKELHDIRFDELVEELVNSVSQSIEKQLQNRKVDSAFLGEMVAQDIPYLISSLERKLKEIQRQTIEDEFGRLKINFNPFEIVKDTLFQSGAVTKSKIQLAILKHLVDEFKAEYSELEGVLQQYIESKVYLLQKKKWS